MVRETTKVWLYDKSPFDMDFENVYKFDSKQEMDDFFDTDKPFLHCCYKGDTVQQLGRSGEIYVKGRVEQFESVSYMKFINKGRTYYAFVLDVLYQNENTSLVLYEIDVFNTYQLEIDWGNTQGVMEQASQPNNVNQLVPYPQGISTGQKYATKMKDVGLNVEWLVIVGKPSTRLSTPAVNGGNDANKMDMSFSGTQKAFKYYVVPLYVTEGSKLKSRPFKIGNHSEESYTLKDVFVKLFGLDQNATAVAEGTQKNNIDSVNNIVNMYITRSVGFAYSLQGDTVIIDTDGLDYDVIKLGNTETNFVGGSFGPTSGNSASYSGGALTYGGHTISKQQIDALAKACAKYGVWLEGALCQLYHESLWGDSNVAKLDNNWGGLTWAGQGQRESGVTVTRGSARPANEGGYYMHFANVNDYFLDYCNLISDVNGGANAMYHANGKNDITSFTAGLFRPVAKYDYASAGHSAYLSAMTRIYNGLKPQFEKMRKGLKEEKAEATGRSAGDKPAGTPKIDGVLQKLNGMLGQTVGTGQCYALVSWYAVQLTGKGIGAGFNRNVGERAGGDTYNAKNISTGWNWASAGCKAVSSAPSVAELKTMTGAIINIKGNSGDPFYTSDIGHTLILAGIEGDNAVIIDQNFNWTPTIKKYTKSLASLQKVISGVVLMPEQVAGGVGAGLSSAGGGNVGSNGSGQNVSTFSQTGALIYVKSFERYNMQFFELPNLKREAYDSIKEKLKDYYGKDVYVEKALLTSEFVEIEIMDGFGNNYIYDPAYLDLDMRKEFKYTGVLSGNLGESNQTHFTIVNYKHTGVNSLGGKTYKDILSTDKSARKRVLKELPELLKHGINDLTGKNVAILNDSSASYIQANANQMTATQLTFKENKDMQYKQAHLATQQTALTNAQSGYNAQYAVESAQINTTASGVSALGKVLGNIFQGNLGSAIGSGIKGGFDFYQATRAEGKSVQDMKYNAQQNMLRSQSTVLSNLQGKMAINQQIRSYNANLADIDRQPTSVQQIGSDIGFQTGNSVNGLYWRIGLPYIHYLSKANTYIQRYGLVVNESFNNLGAYLDFRERFAYVKANFIRFNGLQANQQHETSLESIFMSGVRIWKWKNLKGETRPFDLSKDNVTKDSDKELG